MKKARSVRAGVLGAASLLVLGVTSTTTAAHALVGSRFAAFSASTTALRIDADEVTFTGQLATRDGQPISGETVELDAGYSGVPAASVGQASTDADGAFSLTVSFPHGTHAVEAHFAGDGQYGGAFSDWIIMNPAHARVRFVMNPSPPTVVVTQPYAFSGTVQALWSDGVWHPVPGVQIAPGGWREPGNPVTADDGTFTVQIAHYYLIMPVYQLLAIDNLGGGYVNDYSEPLTLPEVLRPSRVAGFTAAPVPYPGNDQVRLGATIVDHFYETDGSDTWTEIPWPTVQVWFRPKGSSTWKLVDTKNGGLPSGAFTDTLTGSGYRDGTWQLRVPDQQGLLASSGRAIDVHTGVGTAVSNFKTSSTSVRKGRTFTLSGKLLAANKAVLRKKTVKFSFRAKGHTTWTYMGSATTDQYAAFKRTFTAKSTGDWRASYAGDSVYLPATGPRAGVRVS